MNRMALDRRSRQQVKSVRHASDANWLLAGVENEQELSVSRLTDGDFHTFRQIRQQRVNIGAGENAGRKMRDQVGGQIGSDIDDRAFANLPRR